MSNFLKIISHISLFISLFRMENLLHITSVQRQLCLEDMFTTIEPATATVHWVIFSDSTNISRIITISLDYFHHISDAIEADSLVWVSRESRSIPISIRSTLQHTRWLYEFPGTRNEIVRGALLFTVWNEVDWSSHWWRTKVSLDLIEFSIQIFILWCQINTLEPTACNSINNYLISHLSTN